jgi:hypothetical protein
VTADFAATEYLAPKVLMSQTMQGLKLRLSKEKIWPAVAALS